MLRTTDDDPFGWPAAPSRPMPWDEKLFLAVVAFLVLRGLLKASEASDRQRVRDAYEKLRQGKLAPSVTSDSMLRRLSGKGPC